MTAYYNEIDPKAAAWIRELIKQGHVAPGDVDERSITDVQPADLRGYTQCHFFAGIAVWSYALRRAGWADDRPVWTGSCPCQPFSAAGKGEGYADERHLWPHWNRLISECRPSAIFGEQVDAAIRTGWLDDVCLSLESLDYAVGAVSFPACSVGAPHIRQRLYFVAEGLADAKGWGNDGEIWDHERETVRKTVGRGATDFVADTASSGRQSIAALTGIDTTGMGSPEPLAKLGADSGATDKLADADRDGRQRHLYRDSGECRNHTRDDVGNVSNVDKLDNTAKLRLKHGQPVHGKHDRQEFDDGCESIELGNAEQQGLERLTRHGDDGNKPGWDGANTAGSVATPSEPGATNGFWSNAEWIACRDGKSRPVEPGVAPLVTGATARVVKLRGYGNAINSEAAKEFISSYMEIAS